MKILSTLTVACIFLFNPGLAQKHLHEFVVLLDGAVGVAAGSAGGLAATASVNAQLNKHLITLRTAGTTRSTIGVVNLGLAAFPVPTRKSSLDEYALLYGWAFTKEATRFALSLGYAHNRFTQYLKDPTPATDRVEFTYGGLAFEGRISFFTKPRQRIYWLRPVASSFELRLFGNISKNTYAGLGLGLGLGYRRI